MDILPFVSGPWHNGCFNGPISHSNTTDPGTMLMKSIPNDAAQAADSLPKDLNFLMDQIQCLPEQYREQLLPSAHRVAEFTKRRRKILNLIQEALSQLRLDMKYLVFDLEATRRERDQYRAALEGGDDDRS